MARPPYSKADLVPKMPDLNSYIPSRRTLSLAPQPPDRVHLSSEYNSVWLAAKTHREALEKYIEELPSLFQHHSQQNRLRRSQELQRFLDNSSLSPEHVEAERQITAHACEEHDDQLRQIIYSPAIIAIVSCFEMFIKVGFRAKFTGKDYEKFQKIKTMRKTLESDLNMKDLLPNDLNCIIEARNVISHVNGWIEYYNFNIPPKAEFLQWTNKVGFREDSGILVADELSVMHCLNALQPFFSGFPRLVDIKTT